jgi:hypothetical protein
MTSDNVNQGFFWVFKILVAEGAPKRDPQLIGHHQQMSKLMPFCMVRAKCFFTSTVDHRNKVRFPWFLG